MSNHAIANSSVSELNPDVAMDHDGNTIVVYEYAQSLLDHDIRARNVSNTGVLGSTINVEVGTMIYGWYATDETHPTVALSPTGGDFVVAYQRAYHFPTTLYYAPETIVREMTAAGTVRYTNYLGDYVITTPQIAMVDTNDYFMVYMAFDRDGDPGLGVFRREAFWTL